MSAEAIRVLTYNVKMLPSPFGDGDADEARAQVIADDVLALQPAVDVVCLQEVFNEDVRRLLQRAFADALPHQVPKCHDTSFFSFDEDSGLFFASALPFRRKRRRKRHAFREFSATAPFTSDYFTDKGVFGAMLDAGARWGEGMDLCVFQTHLQSDHTIRSPHPATRARQLLECHHFMDRFLAPHDELAGTCAVFVGDFNVIAETETEAGLVETDEYLALLEGPLHAADLWRAEHADAPGHTWDGPRNSRIPRGDDDQQRLDYVFALDAVPGRPDGEPLLLRRLECAGIALHEPRRPALGDLSDHYGLLADLRPHPPAIA